jgi:hypothetical protein
MAAFTANNYTQITHNGAYGNKSTVDAVITLGTYAQYDTLDLAKISAGARVLGGIVMVETAVGTSTLCFGVRYADGTSTGGTTGTAVVGTGVVLTTALAIQTLSCVPFVNDADTILYATVLSPGFAPGANIEMHAVVDYIAEGNK